MFRRSVELVLVVCVVTSTLWAATDSFVGDWKLNPSKSTFVDQMKVSTAGGDKYVFDFGGGPERIAVNGTDQNGAFGSLLSVTVEGPDAWKVVRKKDGRTLLTANWKLSADGNSLTDNYTEFAPNGKSSTVNYLYKRTAAGTGFAGTWESTTPMTESVVLQIRPNDENGLSFLRAGVVLRKLKLDGKDHPVEGRDAGATLSSRRVDARSVVITNKLNGKVTRTETVELSPDLKTLTRTVQPLGQRDPAIYVYERQ
jgi:hypothetical protein